MVSLHSPVEASFKFAIYSFNARRSTLLGRAWEVGVDCGASVQRWNRCFTGSSWNAVFTC